MFYYFLCFLYSASALASVISAKAFQEFCDYVVDREVISFDPCAIKKGDTIFVYTTHLDYFLEKQLPLIREPFILVTSNGFGTNDETYLPILECPQIAHWFGTNLTLRHPKATLIPLGITWIRWRAVSVAEAHFKLLNEEAFFREKPYSIYVNWSYSTHGAREAIQEHFANFPETFITKRLSFPQYMQTMGKSRFVISPRGINIDCFRTWESLYAGSIPVVESLGIDPIYQDLPIIIATDLSKVTPEWLEQEYLKLQAKKLRLEKLSVEYWFREIEERKALLNGT